MVVKYLSIYKKLILVIKFNLEGGISLPKVQVGVSTKFMRYVIVISNAKK